MKASWAKAAVKGIERAHDRPVVSWTRWNREEESWIDSSTKRRGREAWKLRWPSVSAGLAWRGGGWMVFRHCLRPLLMCLTIIALNSVCSVPCN
jgi:hypothetical protein